MPQLCFFGASPQVVCTLGPKSREVPVLEELLKAGMSVARFNFSHGSHEYHQVRTIFLASEGWSWHQQAVINACFTSCPAGHFGQPAQSHAEHKDYVRGHARHKGLAAGKYDCNIFVVQQPEMPGADFCLNTCRDLRSGQAP